MPATQSTLPATASPAMVPSLGTLAADVLAGPGANSFEAAASLSSAQRVERLEALFRLKAAAEGEITLLLGETARTQSYKEEGATSAEAWTAERFGISTASARTLVRVAERAPRMPRVLGSLCAGDISFDKVRVVSAVASRRSDRALAEAALGSSVRELAEVAHGVAAERRGSSGDGADARSAHEGRYLRFNERCRTMTLQVPPESFAEVRACIDARAATLPDGGESDTVPLDQRRCDGFMGLVRSSGGDPAGTVPGASPYLVVAHVPLAALVDEAGAASALAGELERDGLIDTETIKRIACDATIVIGVDDEAGHTMYEGRQRRLASATQRREVHRRDRHCRFPGCDNVSFAALHHIEEWKPGGGTDLPNLALLCQFHHAKVVHRKGWTMTGDANAELTFVGPSGRVMVSRPSPLWTRVTAAQGGTSGPDGASSKS